MLDKGGTTINPGDILEYVDVNSSNVKILGVTVLGLVLAIKPARLKINTGTEYAEVLCIVDSLNINSVGKFETWRIPGHLQIWKGK